MHHLSTALVLGMFALTGCNGDDSDGSDDTDAATFGVTLTGEGYAAHAGAMIYGAVVDEAGAEVASASATVGEGDTFTLDFGSVARAGDSYTIGWYADINESGTCDEVPVDHVWQRSFGPVSADIVESHTHATDFASCL